MATHNTPGAIRGTQDIFGKQAECFAHIVDSFDKVRRLYNFRRAEFPVMERTEVFARSLGETTDVVAKEMYTFADRGGDSVTLRPEFTAGIARAYLTNGWQQHAPLKVATHGPLFRYERPQKGRYRQFHQIDAEIIGASEPQADIELLVMAGHLLRELGIDKGITLQLNTLGDATSREAWRNGLVAHFEAHKGGLSEDSLTRLATNPLRILDSKDPRDRPIADAAPDIDAFLTDEAGQFFENVCSGLDTAGIIWTRNARLVRGLDYYRHTAFEFVPDSGSEAAEKMGSQSTILGGGRYDGLIENLGGPATPAVGWAAGIERLAMLVGEMTSQQAELVIMPASAQMEALSDDIARYLRHQDTPISVEKPYSGSYKKRFDKAKNAGFSRGLSIEAAENGLGLARIRDMNTGSAEPVRARVEACLKSHFDIEEISQDNSRPWLIKGRK